MPPSSQPRDCASWAQALGALVLALAAGCATLPGSRAERPVAAPVDPSTTTLGRRLEPQAQAHPAQSAVRLLASGSDALAARKALADAAERTLDLQYYSLRDDRAANAILAHVALAAERGVRVRILLDDLDAAGRDAELAAFATHPGVDIRVFNPFAVRGPFGLAHVIELLGDEDRLQRRMHNKLFLADGVAAIVGGRNLGNEYFTAGDNDPFVDLDLLIAGPAVAQLAANFEEFWASRWSVDARDLDWRQAGNAASRVAEFDRHERELHESGYGLLLRSSVFGQPEDRAWLDLDWAPVTVFVDHPDKLVTPEGTPETHFGPRLRQLLETSGREILVVSPYLVPGREGVALLGERARGGVRVRALTNSLASTDVIAAHAGYARYRERLLAAGVELYEMRPGGHDPETHARRPRSLERATTRLHAKAFVIDRRYVFVGSLNLDPRSDHLNTEVGVLVDSPTLAAEVATLFERMIGSDASFALRLTDGRLQWIGHDPGVTVTYDDEPHATLAQRLAAKLLALLVREELL